MTRDERPQPMTVELRESATVAVDELRQVLDAVHRDDLDQLLRPMLQRADELAGRDVISEEDLAQLLDDLRYARALLTGGVIV